MMKRPATLPCLTLLAASRPSRKNCCARTFSSCWMSCYEDQHDGRVLWKGPLFGRLSKAGREYLIKRGSWIEQEEEPDYHSSLATRLEFAWPSKSGPQFTMQDTGTMAARIRPYPKDVTDILDDKLSLAVLIQENVPDLAPPAIFSPHQAKEDKLYFVKHRYGAQGKSVYVYNKRELEEWWEKSKNTRDFVIQEEVKPALDRQDRKFVLRSHVLLVQSHKARIRAYLHRDVICLPHASPYASHDKERQNYGQWPKSAFISQSGKKHPKPNLLHELEPSHPAAQLFQEIRSVTQRLLSLAATSGTSMYPPNPFQQPMGEQTTCFALLGLDLLVSADKEVMICEVNSHPALGWGTMTQVPQQVFRRLTEDTLSIVVFKEHRETEGYDELTL